VTASEAVAYGNAGCVTDRFQRRLPHPSCATIRPMHTVSPSPAAHLRYLPLRQL